MHHHPGDTFRKYSKFFCMTRASSVPVTHAFPKCISVGSWGFSSHAGSSPAHLVPALAPWGRFQVGF